MKLSYGGAFERAVDRSEMGIVETLFSRAKSGFVLQIQSVKMRMLTSRFFLFFSYHSLWIFDMTHAHALDLLGRQETELDLLDGAQRRTRVLEEQHHG